MLGSMRLPRRTRRPRHLHHGAAGDAATHPISASTRFLLDPPMNTNFSPFLVCPIFRQVL